MVSSEFYRSGGTGYGGSGSGGGQSYKMLAPSNPQAVNQYVREYNRNRPGDAQQPKYDYNLAALQLQQFHHDAERK